MIVSAVCSLFPSLRSGSVKNHWEEIYYFVENLAEKFKRYETLHKYNYVNLQQYFTDPLQLPLLFFVQSDCVSCNVSMDFFLPKYNRDNI